MKEPPLHLMSGAREGANGEWLYGYRSNSTLSLVLLHCVASAVIIEPFWMAAGSEAHPPGVLVLNLVSCGLSAFWFPRLKRSLRRFFLAGACSRAAQHFALKVPFKTKRSALGPIVHPPR